MFQKYYEDFIKEQKSTETQKNFELISHLLNRLAKKATFNLENTALIHFNDYLYDIITPNQSSKEDLACYAIFTIGELNSFRNYLIKKKYVKRSKASPFHKSYYELPNRLKKGLEMYKKIAINHIEYKEDYEILIKLLDIIVNEIEKKVNNISDSKYLLYQGTSLILLHKVLSLDVTYIPFTFEDIKKKIILSDEDKYLISKLIDFIYLYTNTKYSLDDAVDLFIETYYIIDKN